MNEFIVLSNVYEAYICRVVDILLEKSLSN